MYPFAAILVLLIPFLDSQGMLREKKPKLLSRPVLWLGTHLEKQLLTPKWCRLYPAAWVFVFVEFGVAIPALFHSLWSVFVLKSRKRQKLRLRGDVVPTVDVFITCCGEDDDLVLNTARAACAQDYPPDRFRVIVLDDGQSTWLSRAVAALHQERYPNLYYRSRENIPGKPHHFKAGNLNYGLEETMKFAWA